MTITECCKKGPEEGKFEADCVARSTRVVVTGWALG